MTYQNPYIKVRKLIAEILNDQVMTSADILAMLQLKSIIIHKAHVNGALKLMERMGHIERTKMACKKTDKGHAQFFMIKLTDENVYLAYKNEIPQFIEKPVFIESERKVAHGCDPKNDKHVKIVKEWEPIKVPAQSWYSGLGL